MRAVDCKHLELFTLNPANPAWCLVGGTVPGTGDGIAELGKSRLTLGKIRYEAQSHPALVLSMLPAQDRRSQVCDHRCRQDQSCQAIQQDSDLGQKTAA